MPSVNKLSARKKPIQSRSKETVGAILKATARILSKGGSSAATTNHIAEVAGVSVGSLYQYFPNRDSIFTALFENLEAEILRVLEKSLTRIEPLPLEKAVGELTRDMIDLYRREPEVHREIYEIATRVAPKNVRRLVESAQVLVFRSLQSRGREVRRTQTDLASFVIVVLVKAVTHEALVSRPQDLRNGRLHRELSDLVFNYLQS